jgi:hypothetical protein
MKKTAILTLWLLSVLIAGVAFAGSKAKKHATVPNAQTSHHTQSQGGQNQQGNQGDQDEQGNQGNQDEQGNQDDQDDQDEQDGQNGQNGDDQGSSDAARIRRGFDIAPVFLNLAGKNRALVGLGSYIVNAQAGCNDCHTWPNFAPNGDPYRGQPKMINSTNYLAGGRPFGPFRSRNLTPDPTSSMTPEERYQEFVNIMRTGVDPDSLHPQFGPLLQVMPWSVYQDMTDRDLRAIFEYLSAIPHAEPYCTAGNPDPICQP